MLGAMTDLLLYSDRIEPNARPEADILAIFTWLDAPHQPNAEDELALILGNLASLRASRVAPQQRATALERTYTRSMSVLAILLPSLTGVALTIPISRKTRQLSRHLQDLLRTLAEDLLPASNLIGNHLTRDPPKAQDINLWKSLYLLAQHLLISHLVASPACVGIWQLMHQTYDTARRLGLTSIIPEGASSTLRNIYYSAILLDCAQPASFTSCEVDFIAAYLGRFADRIDSTNITATNTPSAFWIDPTRDAAAYACSRKTAPPDTSVHYFSCVRLAALLKTQLAALEAGSAPQQINLPEFAGKPAGRGVLRRLIAFWGEPGKRRFPRRRQNYRAVLCASLDSLWHLFQEGDTASIETSSWMLSLIHI